MQGTAVVSGDPEIDLPKATALGKSLLIFTAVPWTLCLVLYTGLHWTYRRDCPKRLAVEQGPSLQPVMPELQRLRTASSDA